VSGFSLLWSSLLRSSLWIEGTKEMKLLFLTLMMMKDAEGVVRSSFIGLVDAAKLTTEETKEALAALMAPDKNDSSKVMEGRRVVDVPGGWKVVNHEMYQFSTEAKRLFWRAQKAAQREKAAAALASNGTSAKPVRKTRGGGGPSNRERMAEKLAGDGKVEEAEKLAEPVPLSLEERLARAREVAARQEASKAQSPRLENPSTL
jgi:hypothetical protein